MARVLKPERWCSLVFHHKEPALWTNIVETAKEVGLEFKNSTVQHTKLPSWHKVDVPQSVMSAQMIINFIRKDNATFFFADKTVPLEKLILDVAEREIVKRKGGANLEEIINSLVPELFLHNIIDKSAQTKTDYIMKLLGKSFDFDKGSLVYRIKDENSKNLGSYISMQEKIKMYLTSYLRGVKRANFDDIITAVLPNLINGRTPSNQEILNELRSIANFNGKFWVYQEGKSGIQRSLHYEFDQVNEPDTGYSIPETSEHNQMIYRLAKLGDKYRLKIKIGDKERGDSVLNPLSHVPRIQYEVLKPKQLTDVNQIDCLWFAKRGDYPLFAFEVEHSTTINSAFERFISLLKANSDIGSERRLILVISRKKRKDFDRKIKQSSYIGSPHYINNKIRYIFEESLAEKYEELMKEKDFTKFEGLLNSPELE